MGTVRKISAALLGLVYLSSGILKCMDPVGTGFIVGAWLGFLRLGFLNVLSYAIGISIALLESFTGVMLLSGVWKRTSAVICSSLTLFFTIITLLLLLFNPEMDCGCFGETVHLTHFQSFLKNILLCGLCAISFIPFKALQPSERKMKYVTFAAACLLIAGFTVHSAVRLPLVDGTPFSPGASLSADPSEASDVCLSFFDADGTYLDSLAVSGNVALVSVYTPERLSRKKWMKVESFLASADESGLTPILLVSADPDEFDRKVPGLVCFADYKTLATLNRSNGGATFLSDGEVICKWPVSGLPDGEELSECAAADPVEILADQSRSSLLWMQGFSLVLVLILLVV